MNLNEYQGEARNTAIYGQSIREYVESLGIPDATKQEQLIELLSITYTVLGLAGEAGELAGKLKKIIRDDKGIISSDKLAAMKDENGDCLWYISENSRNFGENLEKTAVNNINKLAKRKNNGTLVGSGDNR
jgi:NTP pyrophosphatase (non-canonical NTP hydrolase)